MKAQSRKSWDGARQKSERAITSYDMKVKPKPKDFRVKKKTDQTEDCLRNCLWAAHRSGGCVRGQSKREPVNLFFFLCLGLSSMSVSEMV